MNANPENDDEAHRDPLSGEPDRHPIATGVGAASGAAAGAGLGAAGGPVGAMVGGTVGALVGAFAGKALAGGIDLPAEAVHWEKHFRREPYFHSGFTFADYWPAYLFGMEQYRRDADFDQLEADMETTWDQRRGESRLTWADAREAARASWERLNTPPGPALPP